MFNGLRKKLAHHADGMQSQCQCTGKSAEPHRRNENDAHDELGYRAENIENSPCQAIDGPVRGHISGSQKSYGQGKNQRYERTGNAHAQRIDHRFSPLAHIGKIRRKHFTQQLAECRTSLHHPLQIKQAGMPRTDKNHQPQYDELQAGSAIAASYGMPDVFQSCRHVTSAPD